MGVFNADNDYTDETVVALFPVNHPPSAPTITGPKTGKIKIPHQYNFTSIDSDGDNVSYYIEWMYGNITPWTSYQASGIVYSESHIWNKRGRYTIKARAKDEYLEESDWAELDVTMPRNKPINTPFLKFLENHLNLFSLLQILLYRMG